MTASEHSGDHVRLPPRGARSWYDVLDVARDAPPGSVIVFIVCDRGDKYLSVDGLFPA